MTATTDEEQPPRLAPETIAALLRECVTVVQPGEVLAVRLPLGMSMHDVARAREITETWGSQAGIRAVALVGEEFAAVTP